MLPRAVFEATAQRNNEIACRARVEQAFRPAVRLVSFPALAAEVQMTVSLLLQSCNRKPRNSFHAPKPERILGATTG